jgi:uroporphyrinogen-III synthase
MRIACVGESTAEVLQAYQLDVELIAQDSTAEGLAKELIGTDSLDSANVLVITGNRNREILVDVLEGVGRAIVDTLPVYQTDFADVLEAADLGTFLKDGADAIIFTSSSTALSYVEQSDDLIFQEGARKPILCSFGPQTSKTLQENDLKIDLEASHPSTNGLIDALVEHFSASG